MTDTPSTETERALREHLEQNGPHTASYDLDAVIEQAWAEGRQQAVRDFDAEMAAMDGTRARPRPLWAIERLRRAVAGLTSEGSAAQRNASESGGRAVQDDGLGVARQACLDILMLTVDHLDDLRLRRIHQAASRGAFSDEYIEMTEEQLQEAAEIGRRLGAAPPLHDPEPDR